MDSIVMGKTIHRKYITPHETPIWKFNVYDVFTDITPSLFEFSRDIVHIQINDLMVMGVSYSKVGSIIDVRTLAESFCQDGNACYFQMAEYDVWWLYDIDLNVNVSVGFTLGETEVRNGILYKNGLLEGILRKESFSEWGLMSFQSFSVKLTNRYGQFDNANQFYGNLTTLERDGEILGRYYVDKASIQVDEVSFSLKDPRSNISNLIEQERFTIEEYPKINEELIGTIKPIGFGILKGIPAIMVDELDIYNNDDTLKQTREFFLSNNLLSVQEVIIKKTQPESGAEVWSHNRPFTINSAGNGIILHITELFPNGIPADTSENYIEPFIVKVNCTCGETLIGDMLIDILKRGAIAENTINEPQIKDELNELSSIGIYYDSETKVFEVMENIQNSSSVPFILYPVGSNYEVRRLIDYESQMLILEKDIVSIPDISVDYSDDSYATEIKVAYSRDWTDDAEQYILDDSLKAEALNLFKVARTAEIKTFLTNKEGAEKRIEYENTYYKIQRAVLSIETLLEYNKFELLTNVYISIHTDRIMIQGNFYVSGRQETKDKTTKLTLTSMSDKPYVIRGVRRINLSDQDLRYVPEGLRGIKQTPNIGRIREYV